MKAFFEEYGAVIIVLIVVGVLLVILGTASVSGVGISGTGVAGAVAKAFQDSITIFQNAMTNITIPTVTTPNS